jgi:hypothetical protein
MVAFVAVPNSPTRSVSVTLVVTDGAVIDVELALALPPDAAIGLVAWTPAYARTAPAANWEPENVQAYETGSAAPAILT